LTIHDPILPAEDEQTKRLFDKLERLEQELVAEGFPPTIIAHGLESYGLALGVKHDGAAAWARYAMCTAMQLLQTLQQEKDGAGASVH
jgi:hypothetical protein